MGREVKRVALNFDWPINKVWEGFLMPDDLWAGQCRTCDATGYNEKTKLINDAWYTHTNPLGQEGWSAHLEQIEVDALIKHGRLHDFTHIHADETHFDPMTKSELLKKCADEDKKHFDSWLEHGVFKESEDTRDDEPLYIIVRGWWKRDDNYHPTADEVNEWSRRGLGHDTINKFICVEARAKAAGTWGKCPICKGEGELWRDDAHKEAHNAWEACEPPAGEGWQLWETVSEGSPQSPVCESKEQLSRWMQANGDGNSDGYSKEVADAFVNSGWAPSFIMKDGELMSGVEASVELGE